MGIVYLDASAAVKFVVPERESAALAVALKPDDALVASEILEVELGRACLRRGMPPAAATPILDLVALLPSPRSGSGRRSRSRRCFARSMPSTSPLPSRSRPTCCSPTTCACSMRPEPRA